MTYTVKAAVAPFCLSVAMSVTMGVTMSVTMGGTVMAQAPAQPPQSDWSKLPRMQLERQFAGPLQDTIVQRWRDPVDGMICYIYLPITAAHTTPTANGYVQYGGNTIGTISCIDPSASNTAAQAKKPPAH